MAESVILDASGRPYPKSPPRRIESISSVTHSNVKPAWISSVAPNMSPERLARILREGTDGDVGYDMLTLAEDMEERDLHYYSVLQTRKMAVYGSPMRIVFKGKATAQQEALAAEMTARFCTSRLRGAVQELLDALGKGYAAVQLLWDTTSKKNQWSLDYQREDPRQFQFDRETQTKLMFRTDDGTGMELPPGQFMVHYPRLRSTLPGRGGLARLAAVTWMFKSFSIKDWVAFAEVYGMPLRLAKYDPLTMSGEELGALRSALADLGHDAAGVFPNSVELEVKDVNRGSSGGPFENLARYFDEQLSKAVLGQTMTSDNGSSQSQAIIHERVRQDVRQGDALNVSDTVDEQAFQPWAFYNYGSIAEQFRFEIDVSEPEDRVQFTQAALPWVKDGGLKVSARQIREKFGLLEPEDEQDTLGGT